MAPTAHAPRHGGPRGATPTRSLPAAGAGAPGPSPKRPGVDSFLRIPRGRLGTRVWGPEDGVPFLGLHGWMDNAATWDRLAPLLRGVRLVALDLPGHGRADHLPEGFTYHFVDWAFDVVDAADALGWREFGILGHSMGAGIAPLVAAGLPERVKALVLVEGLGAMSETPEGTATRLAQAFAERRVRTAGTYDSLEHALQARLRNTPMHEGSARLLVTRGTEPVEGGVRFTHDPRLREPSRMRFTEEQVRALLHAVRCATLVVQAREGLPLAAEFLDRRLTALREARFVSLPGGHHLHLDEPEALAPVVQEFLDQHVR